MFENFSDDDPDPLAEMVNDLFRDLAFEGEAYDESESSRIRRELRITPVLGAEACRDCPLCASDLTDPGPWDWV